MAPLSTGQLAILDQSIEQILPNIDFKNLDKQSIFVTGGTGFFGIWLLTALRLLNASGINIDVCVLSRDPEKFLERFPHLKNEAWLTFIQGKASNFEIPDRKFDLLLHAATETSLAAHAKPSAMLDDIFLGTKQVLALAVQCRIRRMLLISSGAVYGTQPTTSPLQPDDSLLACSTLVPSSAYGEGKRVMELMGSILQHNHGIDSIVARCFAFCGPMLPLDGHFAIGNFVRDALYREQITVQGDGTAMRSYLYGADLAIWLLNLLLQGKAGQSYNVGSDEPLSISELAHRVGAIIAPEKGIEMLGRQNQGSGAHHFYVPSIGRARAIGCKPWTALDEAIKLTARFYLS